ncbi:MAG: potassium channel family protein [Bacillota bacterium]
MYPWRPILTATTLLMAIITLGTVGYFFLENISLLQALWLTFASITTVGYGDLVPITPGGKLFTIIITFFGVGVFLYTLGNVVSVIVEGGLKNVWERSKMLKTIDRLQEHIIVCGAGRVGREVINRLKKENVPFVVIETNQLRVESLLAENVLVLEGDATDDALLLLAGIERARGLVSSLPDDALNVYVTLTSKGLNPKVKVVARSNRPESEAKLVRAGADKVISPAVIGGRRMAISILKPASVEFVDTLMSDHGLEFELEELIVPQDSPLAGYSLKESRIKQEAGVMVVAIQRDGTMLNFPDAEEILHTGDLLITIGTRHQLEKFETLISPRMP